MNFSLYDHLLSPVISLDKENNLCYFNFICSTVFNTPPRKLNQLKKISELFINCDYDFEKDLKEARSTKSPSVSPELTFENFNGDEVTVICKFIPANDHMIINLLDFSIEKRLHNKYKEQIKELKETHEQIVKADKLTALGQIIAGIGHEIGTPLIIVENRLNLLFQSLQEKDFNESKKNMLRLKKEFDRITKIFSSMKAVLKNQEDHFEVIDLGSLVDDVLKLFKDSNSAKKIKIEKKVSGNHWVMANSIKLQQVLVNMVKNSIDSLETNQIKKPKITIEILEDIDTQTQRIKVIDNGLGVPENIREKIFDMFFTSKAVSDGTGLGLSISKKIIDAFSGEILLNDTDGGCEFEIVLPNVEMGSFTVTNKYLSGESESEDEKLLFVGDNVGQLNKIYDLLVDKSYILIFTNKTEGLEELSSFLLIDSLVKLIACETGDVEAEVVDLSKDSLKKQFETVEKKFVKD